MVFTTKSAVLLRGCFVILLVALVLPSSAQPLSEPDKQLIQSIEQKDVNRCCQALANKANVNLRGPNQQTPLIYACHTYETMVPTLLDAGADVHLADRFGKTALMHTKSTTVAQALLGKGARVDKKDTLGWTALHWAVWHEAPAVVEVLLEKQECTAELSQSLLEVAVNRTCSTVLEDLLAIGLPYWQEGLQQLSAEQKCRIVERADVVTAWLRKHFSEDLACKVKKYLLTREQWECIEDL